MFANLAALAQSAADATRELRTWLHCPGSAVSKADMANLLALVDSLLTPEPVGAAFATTPWDQLSAHLDAWIPLVRERCELRDKLAEIHKIKVQGRKPLPVKLGRRAKPRTSSSSAAKWKF